MIKKKKKEPNFLKCDKVIRRDIFPKKRAEKQEKNWYVY